MEEPHDESFEKLDKLYKSGDVPWDKELPPPEVIELASSLEPGRALDLGCGYGRATIYLAQLGWQVDGIDFIPDAIAVAAKRSREVGVSARFHIASIIDLGFLSGTYDLAIDVGCGHNLSSEALVQYRDLLRGLLRPGGYFLIFARMRTDDQEESETGPSGINQEYLLSTFSTGFELEWHSVGETNFEDGPGWPSAWFRFKALSL
ncbi:MAG: class I SAM-dependent methyltransferase [Anaerolineae bacterium]|nr:MAG: class I SAM-dependent methyltransferase [Anaerolineae bacterium]